MKNFPNYLNFWLNFSSSFRDSDFVTYIIKAEDAKKKLINILKLISNFIEENLSSEDTFVLRFAKNPKFYSELLCRILDLYCNIKESKLSDLLTQFEKFEVYFKNFQTFSGSKLNLNELRELMFNKPGLAYLDYKGNFSKIKITYNFIVWADSYMEYLFEETDMRKKNFFDYLTDFSKFLLKTKNEKENFYNFADPERRVVDFKCTIYVKDIEEKDKFIIKNKLFNHLNNSKTLICNVSTGILIDSINKKQKDYIITLRANLAPTRENFDDFICSLL